MQLFLHLFLQRTLNLSIKFLIYNFTVIGTSSYYILKLLTGDIFLDFIVKHFFLSCFQGMSDLLFLSSHLIMHDAIKLV